MLDYEWGNPSTIMLSGDEPTQEPDPNRQIFDHHYVNTDTNNQQSFNDSFLSQQAANAFSNQHQHQHHHHFNNQAQQTQAQLHSLYDPRVYGNTSPYAPTHSAALLSLDQSVPGAGGSGGGYFVVPKSEEVSRPLDFASRIGLNLGGRTYFSSTDDDFVNRLYRRSRPGETGSANSPRCQAEGCNADLTHAKHYHRRHKVCEFHSKASTVIAAGLTQRFCQQCSRFHLLTEFDNGKRSCRKRLADHNRRRRKSQQPNQENHKSLPENGRNLTSDNLSRSPPDSGAQSSSSVTVAVSPPRMSLDCFRQRPYQGTASSPTSSSSLFFSSG